MKRLISLLFCFLLAASLFAYVSEDIRVITENLRLRSEDNTSSSPIITLKAGSLVKVESTGRQDTIGGVSSNWIKISTCLSAKDREGNTVPEGTEGWCFGGFTALYSDYYSLENSALKPTNYAINKYDVNLQTTEVEDAVLYVMRDKLYPIGWQWDTAICEYSRCYLKVDGNLYLVAAEYGSVNFSSYSCQKTNNGYLITKGYYSPYGKSDGCDVVEYRYVTEDNGTWCAFDAGHAAMSVVEWNGQAAGYVPSENGNDYVYELDLQVDIYELKPGCIEIKPGIMMSYNDELYEDCTSDSAALKKFSNTAYGIILEEGEGEPFWETGIRRVHPYLNYEVYGDWKFVWVKVQLLDSGTVGWYKKFADFIWGE